MADEDLNISLSEGSIGEQKYDNIPAGVVPDKRYYTYAAQLHRMKLALIELCSRSIDGANGSRRVRLVVTTNRSLTGLADIDGETPTAGDRVLLAGQDDTSQNGPWVAAAGAWTRATDALEIGTMFLVTDGDTGAGTLYWLSFANEDPIVAGTTEVEFSSIAGSGGAPEAHASSHQNGGSDEIATATPAANAIPKATAGGKLDSWITDASTSAKGKIQLDSAAAQALGSAAAGSTGKAADSGHVHAMPTASDVGAVPTTRTLTGTAPITVAGDNSAHDLSANRTIAITAATTSASGAVELATSAESITGTDTDRAVTPAGAAAAQQYQPARAVSGTTATLATTDFGGSISFTHASGCTLAVPDLSSGWPSGKSVTVILVVEAAAHALVVDPGTSVAVNGSTSNWTPTAGYGVWAMTTRDGLNWFKP